MVYFDPGKLIRFQGGLGPLQDMGLNGAMTWSVEPHGETGAHIEWRYVVHGYRDQGFEDLAPVVDQVLGQQLASLAAALEP